MNQPELGNYIAQLRKEKGLTQEELVELCNINVRTIQRIENGDVTPRSYTVKNIFEALGKSIDEVFKKSEKQPDVLPAINYNKSLLGWGIIAGIIYLILGTLNVLVSINEAFNTELMSPIIYAVSVIIEYLTLTVLLIAIAHYGRLNESSLIKNASYGAIALLAIFYIIDFLFYSNFLDENEGIGMVLSYSSLFLYGLIYLFLAIGFFTHRVQLGELAKWAGITGIIGGVSFCLIILFPLGILATLAFEIMLIILLYKAWDNSNKKSLDN
ncbi:helix-turn-helix domain-containing protein [Nonlabens ulvanivorans]|uniref:helix-turn-helix domain-containing protein n=1 Tax=Nonlabens ulvanivorans TaxID=906888 RepID=UPI002941E12C|nr:helix-turn-helix domain-containing protein [Nonlabens ulvanivorans]WOI21851.1 helix-turn-helix domain-containing protein [Nonlabens ulvanivorans]